MDSLPLFFAALIKSNKALKVELLSLSHGRRGYFFTLHHCLGVRILNSWIGDHCIEIISLRGTSTIPLGCSEGSNLAIVPPIRDSLLGHSGWDLWYEIQHTNNQWSTKSKRSFYVCLHPQKERDPSLQLTSYSSPFLQTKKNVTISLKVRVTNYTNIYKISFC